MCTDCTVFCCRIKPQQTGDTIIDYQRLCVRMWPCELHVWLWVLCRDKCWSVLFLQALDSELPVMEPYFVQNPDLSDSGPGLRVTWLGHATVLVEMDRLNILTDPIFSQRASPVQFMGPKRYRGPPCTVEQVQYLLFLIPIYFISFLFIITKDVSHLTPAPEDRCCRHQSFSLWPPGCWICGQP